MAAAVHAAPFETEVQRRLVALNAMEGSAFSGIVVEYMGCLERSHVLEVRLGQLEKESAELQAENMVLATTVALAKESETRSEQVQMLEEKVKSLTEELSMAYKDKAKHAEDLLQATSQLQIVRENNEMQAKELNQEKERISKLQQQVRELAAVVDKERAAHALAVDESEARLAAKEAAVKETEKLQQEIARLVDTIVAMKVEQAELLNQAVQEHESAVRIMEGAKAAAAQQQQETLRRNSGDILAGEGLVRRGLSLVRGLQRSSLDGSSADAILPGWDSLEPTCPEATLPVTILRSLEAHKGGCYGLGFSRTGFRLVTSGGDKTVRLWDSDSGTALSTLEGSMGTVLDVQFTCDDMQVLGGGSDRALRLWDTSTGRVKHTLTGHADKVGTIHCSPSDPARAVSGSADRTIKIWNLNRGYVDRTIVCHSSINAVTTTMDGQIVISGHFDGVLRFWDLRSGKPVNEVTGLHGHQISSVSVCNRSNCILTSSKDDSLKLVDIASHEVVRVLRPPGHLAGRACLSPDDKYAACGLAEGGVCVWDTTSGAIQPTLHSPQGHHSGAQILSSAWSPEGKHLATCDRQGVVVLWHGSGK
mmetsp:Transcript_7337/g.20708  ORF Transcript_7337/g.20708 Transcript_7337/m.20708 type:complete len:592 (-) Transcript_7337:106-1881(-)|eukprot:CAMPEP_0117656780 /NCGR_PEP_ID=MMETSP0804-20121206/4984_1 /TAXON_ID=1074897 /ORGANISM="Tetraselmis astigmatica, Strain CCMP880" /LENGTH=591 /DNA_ID=CAMNT_0005463199 /DNA_START=285 /DNA_END=2060 /DNA_ORIENTATION=-